MFNKCNNSLELVKISLNSCLAWKHLRLRTISKFYQRPILLRCRTKSYVTTTPVNFILNPKSASLPQSVTAGSCVPRMSSPATYHAPRLNSVTGPSRSLDQGSGTVYRHLCDCQKLDLMSSRVYLRHICLSGLRRRRTSDVLLIARNV